MIGRIGILGGTFDPVHPGHVALARAAIDQLGLERLLLIPTGDPPYKAPAAGRGDRLRMLLEAFRDVPRAEVVSVELFRPGRTYTVDTLRLIRARFPDAEPVMILGADALGRLPQWKNGREIRGMCRIAGAVREGVPVPEDVIPVRGSFGEWSSGALREARRSGARWEHLTGPATAEYIRLRGLYLADRPEEELIRDLAERLKPTRFSHTLGVAQTARELAIRFGIDPGKAYIAGLLHDCAKGLSAGELLEMADPAGADDGERACLPVLHAPVGAWLARERYGVRDPAVLGAIRRHTLGFSGAGDLDLAVYTADLIEPGRKMFPGLERVRSLAFRDLRAAALAAAHQTEDYTRTSGSAVHPGTLELIRELEQGGKGNG